MPNPTPRMDCIDFKVLLSPYIDGELGAAQRMEADRHLLECRPCRELMERAEINDSALRALARDPAFAERAVAALPLPRGFTDAVIARVRRRRNMPARRFYASMGLLAAAASIVLAGALFFVLSAGRGGAERESGSEQVDERWETLGDGQFGPPRPLRVADPQHTLAPLTGTEAQLLHNTALMMRSIIETPFEDVAARERLREIVKYDDMLPELERLDGKLDPSARRALSAARAVLFQLARDRPENELWTSMQKDLRLLDLTSDLEEIATESDSRDSV